MVFLFQTQHKIFSSKSFLLPALPLLLQWCCEHEHTKVFVLRNEKYETEQCESEKALGRYENLPRKDPQVPPVLYFWDFAQPGAQ